MQLAFFGEVFNVFNKKLPTPYPAGYTYEGYFRCPTAEYLWNGTTT